MCWPRTMTKINLSYSRHSIVMDQLNRTYTESALSQSSSQANTFVPRDSPIIPAEISFYKRSVYDAQKFTHTKHLWEHDLRSSFVNSKCDIYELTRSIISILSGIHAGHPDNYLPKTINTPFAFLDSYNLWASGHYVSLEESIRILCAHRIPVVILKDEYMTLWPDHLKLLIKTYHLNVINITGFSFSATHLCEFIQASAGDYRLSSLYPEIVHPDIIISKNSFLNPALCFTTSSRPSKVEFLSSNFSLSAFTRTYSTSDSLVGDFD